MLWCILFPDDSRVCCSVWTPSGINRLLSGSCGESSERCICASLWLIAPHLAQLVSHRVTCCREAVRGFRLWPWHRQFTVIITSYRPLIIYRVTSPSHFFSSASNDCYIVNIIWTYPFFPHVFAHLAEGQKVDWSWFMIIWRRKKYIVFLTDSWEGKEEHTPV